MSTPQAAAMKHAPSQQGRTPSQLAGATPPVSTPFSNPAHAAFSPRGPRGTGSSPQQVKKSPATSSTLAGHTGQNPPINFDSPSTAAAMRALDMGFGLENVGLGGLDGIAGFSGDDDKLKKLNNILKTLDRKGYVSEAGIGRLAQRSGLEILSEDTTDQDGRKTRTLVIAGSILALDIVLDNNIVQNISLAFHESPPSVQRHANAAAQILTEDLQLRPNQSPLTKTLDNFALNFERLATLDKLSITPGFNCQEALAGIFVSLERLHEHDTVKVKEQPEMSEKTTEKISEIVMNKRHGRPAMHAQGRVGLALQYWKDRRASSPDDAGSFKTDKVWTMLLGCAPVDGVGLPHVRVSEDWISKDVVKEDTSMEPKVVTLDWQDPENTILPASDDNKDAGMDVMLPDLSTIRVPRVMFTATFDPPVILPQHEWVQLYNMVGVEPPNVDIPSEFGRPIPPTYDSLFFPIPPGARNDPSENRTIHRQRDLTIVNTRQEHVTRRHLNRLFVYKPIYGQIITDIPFAHPQQLIEMLPTLRQYACLSTLLENSFGSKTSTEVTSRESAKPEAVTTESNTTAIQDELDAFMSDDKETPEQNSSSSSESVGEGMMDVILSVHPSPLLQVVFPFKSTSTANISIQILPGGGLQILNENVLDQVSQETKDKYPKLSVESLAEALEVFEDLCCWSEWIQTRLG